MSVAQHNIAEPRNNVQQSRESNVQHYLCKVLKLVGPRNIYMRRCNRHMGAEYCTLHVAKYSFEYWPSCSERYDKNASQTYPLR